MIRKVVYHICAIYLVDVLFELSKLWNAMTDKTRFKFFPFFDGDENWDGRMTLANYVYGFCGHVSWMIAWNMAYIMAMDMHKNEVAQVMRIAFLLECVDLLLYVLTYNKDWFRVFGYGVDFNTVKFFVIIILIVWKVGR